MTYEELIDALKVFQKNEVKKIVLSNSAYKEVVAAFALSWGTEGMYILVNGAKILIKDEGVVEIGDDNDD